MARQEAGLGLPLLQRATSVQAHSRKCGVCHAVPGASLPSPHRPALRCRRRPPSPGRGLPATPRHAMAPVHAQLEQVGCCPGQHRSRQGELSATDRKGSKPERLVPRTARAGGQQPVPTHARGGECPSLAGRQCPPSLLLLLLGWGGVGFGADEPQPAPRTQPGSPALLGPGRPCTAHLALFSLTGSSSGRSSHLPSPSSTCLPGPFAPGCTYRASPAGGGVVPPPRGHGGGARSVAGRLREPPRHACNVRWALRAHTAVLYGRTACS